MEQKTVFFKIIRIFLRTMLSFAIIGGSIGLLLYLGTPERSQRQKGRFTETPTVETAQAEQHVAGIDFEVDGVVIPFREVVVSPEVSGRIVYQSPLCRQGRFVEKGECLFRIDPSNYELDVQRLEAALEQAEASVNECDVEVRNLTEQIILAKEQVAIQQRDLKRYESINDPGVYSESEIDVARNSELSARNSLQQLESQHRLKQASRKRLETASLSAKAQLDRARLDLKRTEICAPLSGVVTAYNIEQDSYVQSGAAAVTIQDTSQLEIRCSMHMQQVGWLWQTPDLIGQATRLDDRAQKDPIPLSIPSSSIQAYRLPDVPVTVTYQMDEACWAWKGSLTSYDGSGVDESTRMMPCRVTVENPLAAEAAQECDRNHAHRTAPPTLLAGMFVKVQVHSKPAIPLLKIQETALIPGNQVWTATGGILKKHQVRVAHAEKGEIVIYAEGAGMVPGDQVVVSPLATPVEGEKVNLMPQDKITPSPRTAPVVVGDGREASHQL